MNNLQFDILLIWGFFIGLIFWGNILRFVQPISNLIIFSKKVPALLSFAIHCLVLILLVSVSLVILGLLPLYLTMEKKVYTIDKLLYHDYFGVTFLGLIIGFLTSKIINSRRVGYKKTR